MDWYKARKFICEISGHSGLSFFDALKSETAGAREVEGSFPEKLKGPVLRKVQFSTISRIDNLVDKIYDDFKNDFYPGEQVCIVHEGERLNGLIRDKANFPEIKNPETGEVVREAFARYFVKILDRDQEESLVDDSNISRDRKVFTKQMLRSFIKNTVTREAWTGAPWLVKADIAEQHHIPTDVPVHLQYGHKVAEKKERKKAEQQDGTSGVWPSNKLPELKPAATKGRKQTSLSQEQLEQLQQQAQLEEYHRAQMSDPAYAQQHSAHMSPPLEYNGYPIPAHPHAHYPASNGHTQPPHMMQKQSHKAPPPPAAPLIKYPIEDMDCPPQRDGVQRPPLKFVSGSQLPPEAETDDVVPTLEETSVGLLLEVWNTLNVYCQVLLLDSFTFDDFVDAMQWSSIDVECELLVEMHCAVLKKLVNSEKDMNGSIQIALPDLPQPEDSDEEEEEQEESHVTTPTPEPDVPARRTRSSLNRMQLAEDQKEDTPSELSIAIPHRAAEMFTEEYGWIERLRKRDFGHGGWQLIMVGLLHQVAGRPRLTEICQRVLTHLAPLDADPTLETVVFQYSTMDINLRVQALQVICHLFLETKTVKNFLEEMAHTMTQFRKLKIEHQRARKEAQANLRRLNDERRILAPLEKSPSPIPELEEVDQEDTAQFAEGDNTEILDSEDDRPITTRSLRRGQDRANERKRKREEEEQRKKEAKEEKANKGSKEYQKILKAIEKERDKIAEHEEQIDIVDGDLREADAYRTRCLGKDRFCNRYWWFERNAMPYGGLPDSSTANAEYANGRLWIQGPDDMERIGYIDVPDEARNNYFRCFQMTPAERKTLEEGPTNLHTASQWGFYDEGEDIDLLIAWLDSRGLRELKLKKELVLQREVLAKYMANRHAYVHPDRKRKTSTSKSPNGMEDGDPMVDEDEEEETEDERIITATTRMSTRMKTYVSGLEDLAQVHRCLRWKNTMAVNELGHRHIDPPPAPVGKYKKGTASKRASGPFTETKENLAPRETRADRKAKEAEPVTLNRQGKPVTRQGTRYAF